MNPLFDGITGPPVQLFSCWANRPSATLDWLREHLPWEQRSMRGGVPMPRLECFFARNQRPYAYSGVTYRGHELDGHPLDRLRVRVDEATGHHFNAVFCNLYRGGDDSIGWHRDDEASLGPASQVVIASLSFGEPRRFRMRRIDDHTDVCEWTCGRGDLLLMKAGCQSGWEHCVPKGRAHLNPRVNLTFRRLLDRGIL